MSIPLGIMASGYVPPATSGPPWTESFNKADGALGPDQTWDNTLGTGAAEVVDNEATSTGSATVHYARLVGGATVTASSQYVQGECYKNGTSDSLDRVRLIVAYVDQNNFLLAGIQANGQYGINNVVGGTFGTATSGSVTWNEGDTFRLAWDGTTMTLLRNGSLVDTRNPSTNTAIDNAENVGFALVYSGTADRTALDNFEAGDL